MKPSAISRHWSLNEKKKKKKHAQAELEPCQPYSCCIQIRLTCCLGILTVNGADCQNTIAAARDLSIHTVWHVWEVLLVPAGWTKKKKKSVWPALASTSSQSVLIKAFDYLMNRYLNNTIIFFPLNIRDPIPRPTTCVQHSSHHISARTRFPIL